MDSTNNSSNKKSNKMVVPSTTIENPKGSAGLEENGAFPLLNMLSLICLGSIQEVMPSGHFER